MYQKTITQLFREDLVSFQKFRRALRLEDQRAFDELMAYAQQHLAAAGYAAHVTPFEAFLLAMLLEEHKRNNTLAHQLEALAKLLQP